ncbi:MAG: AAA family ATPase [Geopsychrobacter sp.]|nr:AAA family ATPase [Geopsychrobacter sp.]
MKLKSFQVTNFRSVRDSGLIDADDVTCLVGKNESGKTALLHALYRLNPINPEDGEFNPTDDYPRADVDDYEYDVEQGKRDPAIVIRAHFELEDADLEAMSEDYPVEIFTSCELELTKGYDNNLYPSIEVSEEKVVLHLIETHLPQDTTTETHQCKSLDDLSAFVVTAEEEGKQEAVVQLKQAVAEVENAGGVRKFIYQQYVKPCVPKFLYFDEYYQMRGQENLNALKNRRDGETLRDADRPLLGLLKHARIDLDRALTATNTQDLKNKLEGAGNRLTKNLLKYWSQNNHLQIRFDVRDAKPEDPEGMQTGINLWAEIYDTKHLATTPMGRRSRGFVWFFSFLAYFGQRNEEYDAPLILLLDEPGLSLHAKAQADLLDYFEKELRPGHQVIYTTHSPFLVDSSHFERVRLVQDNGMETDATIVSEDEGTKVTRDVLTVNDDTLFPLQGALGYEIHQTLFIGPNTLVVEGPSDLIYLKTMSALLEQKGKTSLSEKWTITPAGGAGKIPIFVSLLGSQKRMNIATLMDYDPHTDSVAQQLVKQKILRQKSLLNFAQYVDADEADLEDLFDRDFYLELVNKEFEKEITFAELKPNVKRVLVALKPSFGGKSFNHYRPARYLSEHFGELEKQITDEVIERFEKIFFDLNKLLK